MNVTGNEIIINWQLFDQFNQRMQNLSFNLYSLTLILAIANRFIFSLSYDGILFYVSIYL